ncbi:DUF2155 domain-containing protein [Pseudoruegeria sp. HB172150]|uniref:DUF2155 domain-containing protein n=1 Tax=Pseudoruegeria sp. HB172150 TaxID=2721164 RepID=UPI0015539828
MILRAALFCALAAGPVAAQEPGSVLIVPPEQDGTILRPNLFPDDSSILEPDLDLEYIPDLGRIEEDPRVAATKAPQGAVLRGLDKLTGSVEDMTLAPGESGGFGRLQVTLGECRYPEDNPSGDAYAYVVIRMSGEEVPAFEGWMIASSPALNAMDDPRYDVWVLRCRMS